MDVHARESDDGARTFDGVAVHSGPLRFTFSPVRLITCSKLLVTPWSLPVPATAPDVTHDAVDNERASGGKIMVVQSAGTT